jgi:hypothetical protein
MTLAAQRHTTPTTTQRTKSYPPVTCPRNTAGSKPGSPLDRGARIIAVTFFVLAAQVAHRLSYRDLATKTGDPPLPALDG